MHVENKGHGPLTQTDESLSSSCPNVITFRPPWPAHSMSLSWQGAQHEQLQHQCQTFKKYWLLLAARMINAVSKAVNFQISFADVATLTDATTVPPYDPFSSWRLVDLSQIRRHQHKPVLSFAICLRLTRRWRRPASSVAEWNIEFSFLIMDTCQMGGAGFHCISWIAR